jgi:hypothetical protein
MRGFLPALVIAGLEPAIHPLLMKKMDARVEPAHDGL